MNVRSLDVTLFPIEKGNINSILKPPIAGIDKDIHFDKQGNSSKQE